MSYILNSKKIYADRMTDVRKNVCYEDVLEGISTLNINWLTYLLDEQNNYLEEPCWVFLKKLSMIFTELREEGDDLLYYYIGEAYGVKESAGNCVFTAYRFIGNNSKNYFDILFETNDGHLENIIEPLDITCSGTELFVMHRKHIGFLGVEGWTNKNTPIF